MKRRDWLDVALGFLIGFAIPVGALAYAWWVNTQ